MEPTIRAGDLMVVRRALAPALGPWKLRPREPLVRGAVVVFVSPPQRDAPADPTPTLVKRVVGMPGDTLAMRQGVLWVNGAREPLLHDRWPHDTPDISPPGLEWLAAAAIPDARWQPFPAAPSRDMWGPLVVPADHVFVLGDNREHSKDSRYFGPVPITHLIGTPWLVTLSFDAGASSVAGWLRGMRWDRVGHRFGP